MRGAVQGNKAFGRRRHHDTQHDEQGSLRYLGYRGQRLGARHTAQRRIALVFLVGLFVVHCIRTLISYRYYRPIQGSVHGALGSIHHLTDKNSQISLLSPCMHSSYQNLTFFSYQYPQLFLLSSSSRRSSCWRSYSSLCRLRASFLASMFARFCAIRSCACLMPAFSLDR